MLVDTGVIRLPILSPGKTMVGKDDFGWLSDVSKGPPAFWSQKVSCLLQTWHPLPQLKRWGTPTRIMSAFLLSNRVIYKCKYEYIYIHIINIYWGYMVVNHNNLFQCNRHYWEVPFWKLFIQGVSESTFIPSSGLVHEKGATNTPLCWSGYIILQLFFAM